MTSAWGMLTIPPAVGREDAAHRETVEPEAERPDRSGPGSSGRINRTVAPPRVVAGGPDPYLAPALRAAAAARAHTARIRAGRPQPVPQSLTERLADGAAALPADPVPQSCPSRVEFRRAPSARSRVAWSLGRGRRAGFDGRVSTVAAGLRAVAGGCRPDRRARGERRPGAAAGRQPAAPRAAARRTAAALRQDDRRGGTVSGGNSGGRARRARRAEPGPRAARPGRDRRRALVATVVAPKGSRHGMTAALAAPRPGSQRTGS